MIIKRDYYLKKIIDKRDNGRIKIITGIRRCGKSYLLFNLYQEYLLSNGVKEEQIISIALDEIDNIEYRNPFRLNEYIKEKIKNRNIRYYIFIDEIQLSTSVSNPYVDSKEETVTFIDVLLGLMKRSNLDIYVTGSNSKMLSSDVLTQFRDRGDEIHINPLSFAEVYDLYENKELAFEHYSISFECRQHRKKEQETASLKRIDDSFKKIVIVRKHIIPKHDNDGILYIGIEDFLLNEAIIDL